MATPAYTGFESRLLYSRGLGSSCCAALGSFLHLSWLPCPPGLSGMATFPAAPVECHGREGAGDWRPPRSPQRSLLRGPWLQVPPSCRPPRSCPRPAPPFAPHLRRPCSAERSEWHFQCEITSLPAQNLWGATCTQSRRQRAHSGCGTPAASLDGCRPPLSSLSPLPWF